MPAPLSAPSGLSSNALVRGLTLTAAIAVIVANVIGTGVFLKARVMTCNVGTPDMVVVVWIVAGLLSLAGALTYAELGSMMPRAGGEVNYLNAAYGPRGGFLYGWMQLLVGKTGSQASVAVAFAAGLAAVLGTGAAGTLNDPLFSIGAWSLKPLQLIAVGAIIVGTLLNLASVKVSGRIATVLTVVKVGLVAGVGTAAFMWARGTFAHYGLDVGAGACEGVPDVANYGLMGLSVAGFGAAMLAALWGYDGWNNLALIAGEVKNPQRAIPRAFVIGTSLIIVLYVFVNAAYYFVLEPETIASIPKDGGVVAIEVLRRVMGPMGVAIMAMGLMVSSFGTLHSSVLSGSRVPYAMSRDGLLPRSLSVISPKTRIPTVSVLVQGVWASVLALSGSFDTLTDYVIFGSWIFYGLTTASVFVLRRKYPQANRPYRTWGYPVVPVLFLVVTSFLLINTIVTQPVSSFVGLALIALGLPVYAYYARRGGIPADPFAEDSAEEAA